MMRNRLFSEIYSFLMIFMVFVAATLLVQKGLWIHLEPWVGLLYCSPCLIAYLAGRLLHGKRPILSIIAGILISVVLSLIPISLIWEPNAFIIIGCLLVIPGTFLLFVLPFVSGISFVGSARFIIGLIIQLAAVVVGGVHSEIYKPSLNALAVIYLILGIFTFNRENLRDATKFGASSTGKRRYPPGMRRNNIVMISIIVILSFLVANIEKVKDFAVRAAKFILLKIFELIYFIMKLLAGEGGAVGDDTGGSGFDGFMGAEAREQNPIVEMIVRIIVILVLIALAAFVLFVIYRAIRKLIRNLPSWLEALLDRLKTDEGYDYIDETEDLLGKGGLRKEIAKNISGFWDRLTYRPAKFEDMPDNRSKVRFVFKQLLKRLSSGKTYLRSQTPNELMSEANIVLNEDTEEFIQVYNKARYADSDVPDSDAELAKQFLRNI